MNHFYLSLAKIAARVSLEALEANGLRSDALNKTPPCISHPAADRRGSEPTYETGEPAIDDPLAKLIEIMSEKAASPISSSSSSRVPKWLAKELSAARTASVGVRGNHEAARSLPGQDILEFAICYPTHFAMGVPFIVDVLMYRENDRRLAVLRAAKVSLDRRRIPAENTNTAQDGIKLTVTIALPWPTEPITQTLNWNGALCGVSFQVVPPKYAASKTVRGSCRVSLEGLTIGQVSFHLALGQREDSDDRQISHGRPIKSAFATYADQDRRRVLARIQGIEKLGVNVFMDVNGLRGDERSKTEIFQAIGSSEILYLFWSRNAKRSKWVEQEWRYGLQKKDAGFIDPIPLVDPRKTPPPIELANHKHFHAWKAIHSEDEKSQSTWARLQSWLRD
jgi:hypothetical protein